MIPDRLSRRDFLISAGRLTAAATVLGLPLPLAERGFGAESGPAPDAGYNKDRLKEKLITRTASPLNQETPLELLNTWITPNDLHFVRNHYDIPQVDLQTWKLVVDGEVDQSLTLTFDDLKRFDAVTAVRTLECAGNGRSFFSPKATGTQWGAGAVGTAQYVGVRLADVLGRAGVRSTGKHVMFNGADEPALPSAPDFVRSIPIEKALHPDTLLVHTMNGEPLPVLHGYPLRVIPAGWVGSACVKWLVNIRVLQQPYDGHFMVKSYRMPRSPVAPGAQVDPKEMVSLTGLEVKSLLTAPLNDATVAPGRLTVRGMAWGGEADIAKVEVSTDFGRTWELARLGKDQARYAWRLWEYEWEIAEPGSYLLMSRATDVGGRTQPIEQIWNPSGYLWNVIPRVRVNVAGT